MIKEIAFPIIEQPGSSSYGGNQEWFDHFWGRQAGCGSVLAANLRYVYQGNVHPSYQEFKATMDAMYRIITPGIIGFPFFYKFARCFTDYMKSEGFDLKPVYQKISYSVEEGFQFIVHAIDHNQPVAMLVLTHRAHEMVEENWHWMCVTGYEINGETKKVILSSCGERITRDADILFGHYHKDVVKMMTFQEA